MTRSLISLAAVLSLMLLINRPALAKDGPLVVHEWGTFTSLQDEAGRAIGGINSDDEPLPAFVHELPSLRQVGSAQSQSGDIFGKGFPQSHPDVTMRLETPVLYFHLPAAARTWPSPVTVSAAFHGGWLTQFYPQANVDGPAKPNETPRITSDTTGRLTWRDLRVGGDATEAAGPKTDSRVWLAPRAVDAASIRAAGGESERYLFYRGVGHVDAPLSLSRRDDGALDIRASSPSASRAMNIKAMWFCEFRPDGTCAFRRLKPVTIGAAQSRDEALATLPVRFADDEFGRGQLARLRQDMHAALVSDGLFDDEAEALLNTWELSYFKSWGTRLFFLVPRAWTDAVLPLSISEPEAEVTRVMVGRIDVVTPRHRELLKELTDAGAGGTPGALTPQHAQLWERYDSLGRFRNALVLDELTRRPTASLRAFVDSNSLGPAR